MAAALLCALWAKRLDAHSVACRPENHLGVVGGSGSLSDAEEEQEEVPQALGAEADPERAAPR